MNKVQYIAKWFKVIGAVIETFTKSYDYHFNKSADFPSKPTEAKVVQKGNSSTGKI